MPEGATRQHMRCPPPGFAVLPPAGGETDQMTFTHAGRGEGGLTRAGATPGSLQGAERLLEFGAVDDAGNEHRLIRRPEEDPPVPDPQSQPRRASR